MRSSAIIQVLRRSGGGPCGACGSQKVRLVAFVIDAGGALEAGSVRRCLTCFPEVDE